MISRHVLFLLRQGGLLRRILSYYSTKEMEGCRKCRYILTKKTEKILEKYAEYTKIKGFSRKREGYCM